MSSVYLAKLASRRLPMFVTAANKLRRLRRLADLGHVQARFYPPDPREATFGEVLALTAAGRAALRACTSQPQDEGP